MSLRFLIVVPFLNEVDVLPELLTSLSDQERRPESLVLVDDGSTDGSTELAADFARSHPWATFLRRPPRPMTRDRLATASEFAAFQWALGQVETLDWSVVAKLDADLRLPSAMLRELEEHLQACPRLGIVGTFLREARPGSDELVRLAIPVEHVHGATKFYRRECWEDIAPQAAILGWDTIDERSARHAGWETRSIELDQGDPVHLRPRGSHDGRLRALRRFGQCDWALGEPAPLVLAMALRYARHHPRGLSGGHYLWGYLSAARRRAPRAREDVRTFTRGEEWAKVRRRLKGGSGAPASSR